MDLLVIAILATCTAASALVFLNRITSWRSILKYRAGFDVLFTIGMFGIFAGTLGGALVAALGGLIFSMLLGAANALSKTSGRIQSRSAAFHTPE